MTKRKINFSQLKSPLAFVSMAITCSCFCVCLSCLVFFYCCHRRYNSWKKFLGLMNQIKVAELCSILSLSDYETLLVQSFLSGCNRDENGKRAPVRKRHNLIYIFWHSLISLGSSFNQTNFPQQLDNCHHKFINLNSITRFILVKSAINYNHYL